VDLAAALTADIEQTFSEDKVATVATMDIQGAFDALLRHRLIRNLRSQGWPLAILRLATSFLSDRTIRGRLWETLSEFAPQRCGTPQGSPWSPLLYILYLADLQRNC